MAMQLANIKTNLANKKNYGGKRKLSNIKYIVIHYTANDGDTDESNAKFFKNNITKSSAHYFIDSNSITCSVPDEYVAYSVGGSRYSNYKSTGGASLYNKCTNKNSLSIELCDDKRNGSIYPSQDTIDNAIVLTKHLMALYNVPKSNVIRHFDVTGKSCPAYWCGSKTKDELWQKEFWNRLSFYTQTTNVGYKVKITASELNVRSGAGVTNKVVTSVHKNEIYTIVEEKNGWGRLKSGIGWIKLSYTEKI